MIFRSLPLSGLLSFWLLWLISEKFRKTGFYIFLYLQNINNEHFANMGI